MESSQDIAKQINERVKVSDVVRNPKAFSNLQGSYTFEDLKTEGPLACEWSIQPETTGLNIRGHLKGTMELECVRCLEPFPVPVNVELDEHYVFDRYVDTSEKEKELQSEDFYEVVNEEGHLDLKDLAHQFLILEAENQPACGRSECRFA